MRVRYAAVSHATIELVRTRGGRTAPVPIVQFISDDFGYYGTYGWAAEVDWHQPA
jgi:hypothetical protein